MADPLVVAPGVVVPADALEVRAVRSGGPGGQNVNKVSSKVELRVDLARVEGLRVAQRGRLAQRAASKLDAEGRLLVVSQRTRDQLQNLADARDKVATLIRECLPEPVPRRPTRPTRASKERRLTEKRVQGERKRGRTFRGE